MGEREVPLLRGSSRRETAKRENGGVLALLESKEKLKLRRRASFEKGTIAFLISQRSEDWAKFTVSGVLLRK